MMRPVVVANSVCDSPGDAQDVFLAPRIVGLPAGLAPVLIWPGHCLSRSMIGRTRDHESSAHAVSRPRLDSIQTGMTIDEVVAKARGAGHANSIPSPISQFRRLPIHRRRDHLYFHFRRRRIARHQSPRILQSAAGFR